VTAESFAYLVSLLDFIIATFLPLLLSDSIRQSKSVVLPAKMGPMMTCTSPASQRPPLIEDRSQSSHGRVISRKGGGGRICELGGEKMGNGGEIDVLFGNKNK
jgi:hypothetical protein